MAPASTLRAGIATSSSNGLCHCRPSSQALMAALWLMAPASPLRAGIATSSSNGL